MSNKISRGDSWVNTKCYRKDKLANLSKHFWVTTTDFTEREMPKSRRTITFPKNRSQNKIVMKPLCGEARHVF